MLDIRRILEYAALIIALLLAVDAWISLGLTCQQIGNQTAADYYAVKNCSIFDGPFIAALIWLANVFDEHGEAVTAAFTIILALSTIALWLSTRELWRVTDRTLRHSEDTAQRQLRAYISIITGASFRQGSVRGLRFEFRPVIKNVGQTPAYHVNIVSGIQFISLTDAAIFDYVANLPSPTAAPTVTLGKDQDRFTHTILDRRLSKAELRQYRKGTHTLLVFGTVRYQDIFQRDRHTNFSYMIGSWNKRSAPLWHSTVRHNDSN
jgi:hypothetical protein